ncbi:MAG: MaoC family dehydratase N-terminal domain-containing protein [Reyranella sp.]|uniref:FAS1-like dehydratase domain-containing protein n=1 Tax=Reyranella sp. TaxID=1929291 RepID=UPI003D0FD035
MSLEKLREWVGRTRAVEDLVTPFPVRALSATLDEPDPDPVAGDALPPLWHWLFFLEAARLSKVGSDGHAERGDFLPPVPLPRRMWAGSRFAFTGEPLRVGDTVHRTSRIKSVEPKIGSTGAMVFVTVEHTVAGPRGGAFIEDHDIVYREAPKPGERQRDPRPAPADATWSRKIVADPVLLFRFSALTFNGHRIHYDQPYVTSVEGYPGLIVHGPLMGLLQMELARRSNPGKIPRGFEFRALAPVYAGPSFSVQARHESDGSVTTWIADNNGGLAQQGKATFQ